ncbi:MAG: fructose-2,6-bisphosphatase [Naasia sp.]|jgi:broad specificity phosphatase PhoE|uniref:histidine phosphatase family protein n=1 Tax=Naasia sp. TaxID=2546198 RepID=UPI002602240D|nr:histidine phosphatase family protein [Naasia sp.]MCU1571533.1 fructose-2,6-bisphosphatase [Naasia sp.]
MAIAHDTGHGPNDPRVVLVRHGETEWSRTGQHTGLTDIPLSQAGEYKAQLVGDALAGISFGLVLTSPLARARETARLAGFPAALPDEDLLEWDYGAYEGTTSAEIAERLGTSWSIWTDGVPAGDTPGESAEDVRRRARSLCDRVHSHLENGEKVLLFSHGHFLRALAAVWLGLEVKDGSLLALDTASISSLGFEHGRRVIVGWNRVPGR